MALTDVNNEKEHVDSVDGASEKLADVNVGQGVTLSHPPDGAWTEYVFEGRHGDVGGYGGDGGWEMGMVTRRRRGGCGNGGDGDVGVGGRGVAR
ncbi:hypothetical protein Tco_0983304 [Tanacetum coccineum]